MIRLYPTKVGQSFISLFAASCIMEEQGLALSGKRTIGVFGLISIGFFWVTGGIYGSEIMSKSAPSLCATTAYFSLPLPRTTAAHGAHNRARNNVTHSTCTS
jgi:hypothetical protein